MPFRAPAVLFCPIIFWQCVRQLKNKKDILFNFNNLYCFLLFGNTYGPSCVWDALRWPGQWMIDLNAL